MNKILIVDDEKNVLSSFKKIMAQDGYEIYTASNAKEGLSIARDTTINLLIMDIRMPGMDGLEAFSKFKEIDQKMPIIIMTAYATTETAIEAMQLGAYDYVIKPFNIPQMKKMIEKALETARIMKTEVTFEPKEEFKGDRIIGSSLEMQQIYKTIGQVAASDVNVLLRGESGTGKELIARAIYHYSNRKNKPFLVVNSAAIPETLLESELFGYEKGAFTDAREPRIGKLEQCNGGTIFLDEIGDMPLSIQAKVLRVLEHKSFERLGSNKTIQVDVRLITATNKNLEALIKQERFREDLYYRLNVVSIQIPALREHKQDVLQLVDYFLNKHSKELKKNFARISNDALKILQEYNWPVNIRELENVIKKAMLFCKGNTILPEHIFIQDTVVSESKDSTTQLRGLLAHLVKQGLNTKSVSLYKDIIEEAEKALIIETLKQSRGNQSQTAKLLGISRPTLKDKIEKLGLKKIVSSKIIFHPVK
ncbi:MAG: sigma-54 dependent transcriptional regulator [Candidatus Omnitrophota bacterium]